MAKYKGVKSRLSSSLEEDRKKKPNKAEEIKSHEVSPGKAKGLRSLFNLKTAQKRPGVSAMRTSPDITGRIGDFFGSLLFKIRSSWVTLLGIGTGLLIALIVFSVTAIIMDFNKVKALANFKPNVTTKIYDKNGILISELFKQKREVVPLEKVPKDLINAFVAIEDNEFYEHNGVNIKGIVRAFFINVFSGRIKQGGSTITQQLAKVLLTSGKRNIFRKIKEAFIAIMMEMTYSKDEILALYLNQIFLGHGTYGIESASKLYFNKHVWELNLAESALIASLPSAPNRLSPIRHPKRSMVRHRIVLAKMVELGFISIPEGEKAYLEFWPDYLIYTSEIAPTLNTWSSRVDKAPWFTEHVRRKLIKKYGKEMVYEKGLLVYTTLDLKKQLAGQKILKKAVTRQTKVSSRLGFKNDDYFIDNFTDKIGLVSELFDIQPFRKRGSREMDKINNYLRSNVMEEFEGLNFLAGNDDIGKLIDEYKKSYASDKDLQQVEGCIISINQRTGYIEAMVGGGEFSSINQLNRVIQSRRQPGSAIKPLLYAAAIESGKFTPATAVLDSPIVYLDNEGGDWLPENYEGEYYGLIRLRKALAMSINVISIRIADTLGIDYVMNYYAKLLKFSKKEKKKRISRNLSIALGSVEVSPYELTRAYAIIANGGKDVIPFSVRYIKNNEGKVIENREAEVKKILKERRKKGTIHIIKPGTAQTIISMLKSVVAGGTGAAASPGRTAGGKTGTTNNWRDAWFVGFTPQVTTGLWIGYDGMGLSLGAGQAGGGVAAPVWGEYMRQAHKHEPRSGFPSYASLAKKGVCAKSGLLLSEDCKNTVEEYFIPSSIPQKSCELCADAENNEKIARRGPRENISKDQKKAIIKKIQKDNNDAIIDDIGNDLLGD
ncbi:MAG: PBP1A family penicillin-binding protein [bacterium]|nr:PBP1A family penicillin-binding protein [bacterium]